MKHPYCIITLLLAHALPASAIVNVEKMRVADEADGVSGSLDLAVSGKRGNTQQDVYGIAGRLQRKYDTTTDFLVASYDYGKVNDLINTNKSFLHGRHIVEYQPRRAWEAFVQLEKNEFTRLSFRGLLGGGMRFTLTESAKKRGLYLGVGGFWSREILEARTGLTDDGTENFSRGNLYLTYKEQFNEQVSFVSTTYYQPRINQMSDYRALEQAALAVKMSDKLSLNLSLDIAHDSQPPQGVEQMDTSYNTTLSISF